MLPLHAQGSFPQKNHAQPRKQGPLESFSHKLRRRFSRESKSSGDHREPGTFVFPFPTRPSRSMVPKPSVNLAGFEVGSSLMSERGYDSDAQFISTPNRADYLGRSPTNRALHRIELSDLIEQSHERSETERWLASGSPNFPESHESAFGMRFIPTPNGTLRGASSHFHTPQETRGSQIPGQASAENGDPQDQDKRTHNIRSAPSLSSPNEDELSPTINVPSAINEATLISDWKNFLRASRQRYGLASSGSLPPPSPELVVPKTRQTSHSGRSFTDPRSIHLSEMGISKQLASQSMSSGSFSFSPSIAKLVQGNQHRALTTPSQENMQMRQKSSTSTASQPGARVQVAHSRDPSSFYSRQSSALAGVPSSGSQSLRQSEDRGANNKADVKGRPTTNHAIDDSIPPPDHRVLSRFREHCDSGSLPLRGKSRVNGINALASPRKVSIGWMSGGRRVGYGYSLVEDSEAEIEQHRDGSRSHRSQTPELKAEVVVMATDTTNDRQSRGQSVHPPEAAAPSTSTSSHSTHPEPVSASAHTSKATTLPRVVDSPAQPASEYGSPLFLRPALENHFHQDLKSTDTLADCEALGSLHSSPMVQNGHGEAVQTQQHNSNGDTSFARRWVRLSRSINILQTSQDGKHDVQKTWTIGAPHPAKEAHRATLIDSFDDALYHDANSGSMDKDPTPKLQANASRVTRWALKFSRGRDSRQVSIVHRQDPSQTSSSAYEDCESSSIKRATSFKRIPAEGGFTMPGSFEGSRWASRISRMF
ncbi:hypothetical protein N7492_005053 [Penicillium capsulatum]|uniref:Uncharacterized protein n=1 Tax=Penicillium capsulatum TaxID=69766 RepID=A0A9W9IBM0_9EURO|nr:hypothetical protein N7492_005053 [Penicillium capsulatum]KAJ6135839.1 hypothetical protein N7512_000999 [Penicillium capsulatum]